MGISQKDILGAWCLKTFELLDGQGAEWKSWGQGISGLLIYSGDGVMSVSINRNNLTESENPADYIFYAGDFRISEDEIIHFVTNASSPDRIGKVLRRKAELVDNYLRLSGVSPGGKEFRLTWHE